MRSTTFYCCVVNITTASLNFMYLASYLRYENYDMTCQCQAWIGTARLSLHFGLLQRKLAPYTKIYDASQQSPDWPHERHPILIDPVIFTRILLQSTLGAAKVDATQMELCRVQERPVFRVSGRARAHMFDRVAFFAGHDSALMPTVTRHRPRSAQRKELDNASRRRETYLEDARKAAEAEFELCAFVPRPTHART